MYIVVRGNAQDLKMLLGVSKRLGLVAEVHENEGQMKLWQSSFTVMVDLESDASKLAFPNSSSGSRVRNMIKRYRNGIGPVGEHAMSVRELCLHTGAELAKQRNCGKESVRVIENTLSVYGLGLGMSLEQLDEYSVAFAASR